MEPLGLSGSEMKALLASRGSGALNQNVSPADLKILEAYAKEKGVDISGVGSKATGGAGAKVRADNIQEIANARGGKGDKILSILSDYLGEAGSKKQVEQKQKDITGYTQAVRGGKYKFRKTGLIEGIAAS